MYYSSLLAIVVAATSTLVAATPIPLDYVYEVAVDPADQQSVDGHQRITSAVTEANTQIGYMDDVLAAAKRNPRGREAKIVRQAFGPQALRKPNYAKIRDTVDKMKSNAPQDQMRLHSSSSVKDEAEFHRIGQAKRQDFINSKPAAIRPALQAQFGPQTIQPQRINGMTEVRHDWATGQQTTGKIMLGSQFHADRPNQSDAYRTEYRAGALIHEYAHQHGYATDDAIANRRGKLGEVAQINGNHGNLPAGSTRKVGVGYASISSKPIQSTAGFKNDFKRMRKTSPNMAWNADSYRVLAGLSKAHKAGCVPSKMRKRALMEEDPVAYYLAKRQECQSCSTCKSKAGGKNSGVSTRGKGRATRQGAKPGGGRKGVKVGSGRKGVKSAAGRKAGASAGRRGAKVAGKAGKKAGSRALKGTKSPKARTAGKAKVAKSGRKTATGRKSTGAKGASRGGKSKAARPASGKKTKSSVARGRKASAGRAPKAVVRKTPKAAARKAPKAAAPAAKVVLPKAGKKGGKARRSLMDELD